jgi:hypothetical protein
MERAELFRHAASFVDKILKGAKTDRHHRAVPARRALRFCIPLATLKGSSTAG